MPRENWDELITAALGSRPPAIRAHTYRRTFLTSSTPALLVCGDDNEEYVVKGSQVGRAIINDQIVGRLGMQLTAAVPTVALIDVPQELVNIQPELRNMSAGLAHGSRWVPDCSDRTWIRPDGIPENRERLAVLSLLYGLACATDHQLIYKNNSTQSVYSVDHGHFFPGGPNWTIATLSAAPVIQPDQRIIKDLALTNDELRRACRTIVSLTDEIIADAIAAVPDEWTFPMADRVALAKHLEKRRNGLVTDFS